MARKAKQSSCQVEHWWEERSTTRKGDGKWQRCTVEELRFTIRHMIEAHYLGRSIKLSDLTKIRGKTIVELGLDGLFVRGFNSSTIKFIRHAYPEFFDYARPDHLHEWDFRQKGMWRGKEGLQQARLAIHHMVEEHHLGRSATADDLVKLSGTLLDRMKLRGMLSRRFDGSYYAAIRHAYPEFFDYARPDHLHEWNFPQQGMWKGKKGDDLARIAVRHMLEEHHLGRPARSEDLREINTIILQRLKMGGALKGLGSSTAAVIRHAYPEFFDYARPDHLHEWDFPSQRNIWQGKKGDELARAAIRHMVGAHYLGRSAKSSDLRTLVHEFSQFRIDGMVRAKFGGSPAAALRHAYPEFFDYARPDHLHEWNFPQQGMWKGKKGDDLARIAVRHMLEEHHLGRQLRSSDLKGITRSILIAAGLRGPLRSSGQSPVALIRHAYPELFDYARPDHLHEWDFPSQRNIWQGKKGDELSRAAIRHMLEVHHFGRQVESEDLGRINTTILTHGGLSGMLIRKFYSSPLAALRHAYPEFAETIGRRIKGAADFVEVLESENPKRTRKLIRDLMRHFGDDLVDVADILAVVYTGRLDSSTAMEILQDPTMRPWIVPFDGRGHGPGKPPIDNDFPFYLLEKDQNGVIAGIIRRRLTEWRRKVLGARPSKETRERFLRELRAMQERLAQGGNRVALAAE